MAESQITYEQLFDTLRREKSRDDLQKLEKDFYDKVRIFLSMKQDTIQSESMQGAHSLAAQRAQIEYQNVRKIIKELYDRRERKIITLAMHRTRTDAAIVDNDVLLPEEHLFLESMVHLMVQTREQIISAVEMREPIVVTPSMSGQSYRSTQMPTHTSSQSHSRPTSYEQDTQDAHRRESDAADAKAEHSRAGFRAAQSSHSDGSGDDGSEDRVTASIGSASSSASSSSSVSSASSANHAHTQQSVSGKVAHSREAAAGGVEIADGDTYSSVEEGVHVRFLAPVPKFVGKDLRVFGPFDEGTTTVLPEDIAQILIRKGRAQEMSDHPIL